MFLKILLGVVIGGVLGFGYYKVVGCSSGTCPITSKPMNTILYGAVMGLLFSLV